MAFANARFGYYIVQGVHKPHQPLDTGPFKCRASGSGRYLDYVRWATVELLKRELVERDIAGAIAEVGVMYGDFASLLNYHFRDRRLYLFDTFTGFDSRDQDADTKAGLPSEPYPLPEHIAVEQVLHRLPYPEMVDVRVGWFPESAVGLEDETFAFVHVDVGLRRPTLATLEWFYPRLAIHGYILMSDYNTSHTPGVRQAVREFITATGAAVVPLPDSPGSALLTKM
jgi:O-methyltransferase